MAKLNACVSLPTLIFIYFIFSGTMAMADDFEVMRRLRKSLTPTPMGWSEATLTSFCKWDGIGCDSSNRVTSIKLPSNNFTGTLPPDLNTLSQLITLSLHNNALSGPLPLLANLSNLETIFLAQNNFTSVTLGCFAGLINLRSLNMSDNPNLAPWAFPTDLAQSSNLGILKLRNTNLVGPLADNFDSLPSLQIVDLSHNNLIGSFPKSFNASGIEFFRVNNNGFSGTTTVLASMAQLSQAWLHMNRFTGPIPDLSESENLFDLQLSDNQLTGLVPDSLMRLPSLRTVSLDNNLLQGAVPMFRKGVRFTLGGTNSFCRPTVGRCARRVMVLLQIAEAIGYPVRLADSWKGNDPCNVWSFVVCTKGRITTLNFANQGLQGTISPAFGNLTDLTSLSLNGNNLVGPIPKTLTSLPQLVSLNVSNNNLSGEIPKFPSKVKLSTAGNPLLGQGAGIAFRILVPAAIAVVVVVAVVLFASYKYYVKYRQPKSTFDVDNGHGGGYRVYSYSELQRATENFSQVKRLGSGAFGVVYKGNSSNGTEIAVKRIKSGSKEGSGVENIVKGFQTEIAVLSQVRHVNVVSLLGHCIHGDERFLVYQYMPQGSLTRHLFNWREHHKSPLTLEQRLTIACDVGCGLDYLHHFAGANCIHRDIKPDNILLDDKMRAKVGDFGLAKMYQSSTPAGVSEPKGTAGYLAPEYHQDASNLTNKVDVYSYGVILIELITGKVARECPDSKDTPIHLWFPKKLSNKEYILKVIDETLNAKADWGTIYGVAELAGRCIDRDKNKRPDMAEVVSTLGRLMGPYTTATHEGEEGDRSGPSGFSKIPGIPEDRKAEDHHCNEEEGRSGQSGLSKIPGIPKDRKAEDRHCNEEGRSGPIGLSEILGIPEDSKAEDQYCNEEKDRSAPSGFRKPLQTKGDWKAEEHSTMLLSEKPKKSRKQSSSIDSKSFRLSKGKENIFDRQTTTSSFEILKK